MHTFFAKMTCEQDFFENLKQCELCLPREGLNRRAKTKNKNVIIVKKH